MTGATSFDCPRCGVGLAMTERQGIEIDYCPRCRGVWLDRGELDKIIERAESIPASPAPQTTDWSTKGAAGGWSHPAAPQQQSWRGGHQDQGSKRKKSWLEEIFD